MINSDGELIKEGDILKIKNPSRSLCDKCGEEIPRGDFSYNQEICWECFKAEVKFMEDRIDYYPSWYWDKREENKAILDYMQACIAEMFKKEL